MGVVVSGSTLSVLPYIFVPVFLGTLLKVLLTFHFLRSFDPLSSSLISVSMYEVLLFSLYRNLSSSLILLSSRGGSFAYTFWASTGEVLKVHILMPSMCMLSSFFNIPAEAAEFLLVFYIL